MPMCPHPALAAAAAAAGGDVVPILVPADLLPPL
jgi:hypothetical protein